MTFRLRLYMCMLYVYSIKGNSHNKNDFFLPKSNVLNFVFQIYCVYAEFEVKYNDLRLLSKFSK